MTTNAVKYFTRGGISSPGETEGHSQELSHTLIRPEKPTQASPQTEVPDETGVPMPIRLLGEHGTPSPSPVWVGFLF